MSDGVNITTPDGTVKVATDSDAAAGHVQIFKLAVSADGSAALIPADAANGLDVDVTRLPSIPAGSAAIGTVGVTALPAGTLAAAAARTADLDTGGGVDTVPIMGVALPKSGGAVAGGTSADPIRTDPTGATAQPVTDNGGTLSVDDGGGSLTVDGAVTVTGGKAEDAAASDGDPGVPVLGVRNDALAARTSTDGDYGMVALDSAGRVHTVPGGGVAHDGADSGSPVKVGGRARTSDITAVASDDRTDMVADTLGRQVVTLDQIPENSLNGKANFTNTTAADVIAAQGAGIRIYVTDIVVTNAHASVGTKVEIRDGTTVLWQAYAAPGGGGFAHRFRRPLRLSANTALTAKCATTGADVDVNASGFKAAI